MDYHHPGKEEVRQRRGVRQGLAQHYAVHSRAGQRVQLQRHGLAVLREEDPRLSAGLPPKGTLPPLPAPRRRELRQERLLPARAKGLAEAAKGLYAEGGKGVHLADRANREGNSSQTPLLLARAHSVRVQELH